MGAILEMIFRMKLATLVSALTLALAACGNTPDQGSVLKAITGGTLKKSNNAAVMPSAEDLSRNISLALSNTDKRLAIAVVENHNSFTFLTEVATNGAFSTWGSPDRRTLTEQRGIITSSRGLGADLMSADVGPSVSLILSRTSGSSNRAHIYLDGENQEQLFQFNCSLQAQGTEGLKIGEISSTVTVIAEICTGAGVSFENMYKVTPAGRIVQSRQWLGPLNGYITVQKLR